MLNRTTLMAALPIGAAVVLMGVSCYYQGKWSERWGEFPELTIFADQLKEIPMNVGEWQGKDEEKTDEQILRISGAAGELVRTYRNAAGEEVRMMLMCARFRDVFYHTPDRCYPAAGFEMQSQPQREVIDDAQFFTTSFLKSEPTGTHVERGFWSWSADGTWLAPTNEKLSFSGERALYKLYVFGAMSANETTQPDHDYMVDFIRAFMPALETALRPAFVKTGRAPVEEAAQSKAPQPAEKAKEKPDAAPAA
jgi:Protein of unknown function (DUF3485)